MVGYKYPTAHEIVAEYLRHLDSGCDVTEADVIAKHRQLEDELRSEFRTLHLIASAVAKTAEGSQHDDEQPSVAETWETRDRQPSRPTILRCPHCNKPTEARLEGSIREVECESCGKRFRLIRERVWPKQIAHFELLEKIGVGGFGTVWKARDRELDRLVALKLPRRAFVEESEQEQFIREAQTAAQLNHPNVVKVHEVGVYDASIYIVTELIEGQPLSQHIGNGLSEKEALQLAEPIARALHYAHECGVIHRDLKPQNVILGRDLKPYLTDFGLARRGDADLTLTVSGQILGTPRYMSPEQARGASHSADARSDIFSFGILLYELLTGQVPFDGTSETIFYRVLTEDPVNPRRLNRRISRDIDTVCMKCLEKDPQKRYQTAREVAEELRRVATNTPIVARPVGVAERSYRWARRNPVVASLAGGLLVTFVAASLGGSFLYAQSKIKESELIAERLLKENIKQQKLLTEIRELRASRNSGYRDEIFEKIRGNPSFLQDQDIAEQVRTEVLRSMGDAAAYKARELDFVEPTNIACAAICFDGTRVAIAFESGRIEFRDANNLERVLFKADVSQLPVALGFRGESPNELLSLSDEETLSQITFAAEVPVKQLSSLRASEEVRDDRTGGEITSARFSIDGRFVVFTDGQQIVLWNVAQNTEHFSKFPELEPASLIRCVAASADGNWIGVGHSDDLGSVGGVIRWDRATGNEISKSLNNGRQYGQSLAISDDGTWLAVGCEQTILFDAATMERHQFFHDTEVFAAAFSSDSSYLAIDYISGIVEIKNRKTNSPVAQVKSSPRHMNEGVAFSQDNNRFLAWNQGGIRVLDLNSQTERVQIDVHERAIPTLRFTPDGKRLISCSKDGSVRSWDPLTGQQQLARISGLGQVQCLAIHPSEPWIAVAAWGAEEPLTIWRFSDEAQEKFPNVANDLGLISGLDFSPDGTHLAASGEEGLRVWRLDQSDGSLALSLIYDDNDPNRIEEDKGLVFDNSGRRIFHSDSWGDKIKYYDLQADQSGHLGNAEDPSEVDHMAGWHGLAFTAKNRLAFINPNGELELWDIDNMSQGGRQLNKLVGQRIFSDPNVAVSPTGLLAAKISPKTITIWDLASGAELYTLRGERNTVYSFNWSPDGTLLAVGLSDGGISIWDISKIRGQLKSLGFAR